MHKTSENKKIRYVFYGIGLVLCIMVLMIATWTRFMAEPYDSVIVDEIETPVSTVANTSFDMVSAETCNGALLEVSSSRMGMMSPMGNVLDLRVLETRDIEYDKYSTTIHNAAIERIQSRVSEKDYFRLDKILRSSDLLNAKSEYIGDYYCCDVYLKKKISFCGKYGPRTIELHEFDTVLHRDRSDRIPDRIVQLVRMVDNIVGEEGRSLSE